MLFLVQSAEEISRVTSTDGEYVQFCILIVCTRNLFLSAFIGNYCLFAPYVNPVKVSVMKLIFQALACTSLRLLSCK